MTIEVASVEVFTRILDGSTYFVCDCGHVFKWNRSEAVYCGNCGRDARMSAREDPAAVETYKKQRDMK